MTTEALARLETLYSILAHTLKLDDRVDWETLKERTPFAGDHRFPESEPQRKTTPEPRRSEEHTSELQSLMRISYAVFCLKQNTKTPQKRMKTKKDTYIL